MQTRSSSRDPGRAPWLAIAAALSGAGSCVLGTFELTDAPVTAASSSTSTTAGGGGSGGQAGATGEGGTGGSLACEHAIWPGQPANDDPGDDDLDVVVALRTVDFGEGDLGDGARIGFDLDSRCTCQGEGTSCSAPPWATADACDGPEGRDNAAAHIFAAASPFADNLSSEAFAARAEAGRWSILVRIRDYNGQPNDRQVVAAIYPTEGMEKDPCNEPDPTARWDGTDRWAIGTFALDEVSEDAPDCEAHGQDVRLESPRYVDANAYVADGVLVASLPAVELVFAGGEDRSFIKLTAGFVSGRLAQDAAGGGWALREGTLAGRWVVEDFLKTLSSSFTSGGEPLCTDDTVYQLIKNAVCAYADIASTLGGPTTPCDAVSFALAFEAEQAQLGSVVTPSGEPVTCPAETDPAFDSCGPSEE